MILNYELMNIVYINCLTTNIELKLKNGVKFIDYVPLKFLTNNFYKTININYIAYQKTRYMNMIYISSFLVFLYIINYLNIIDICIINNIFIKVILSCINICGIIGIIWYSYKYRLFLLIIGYLFLLILLIKIE